MSTTTEITRLQEARNTIRDKMIELGLAQSVDKLDVLATEISKITNVGAVSASVTEGSSYTIPKGWHNGAGVVTGIAGGGNYSLQEKTVTPTKSQQAIVSDEGYYGLSSVTVAAIPEAYQNVTSVTAMFAKKVLDSGLLGTVTTVRVRNGHNQALNGILPPYWFDPAQTGGGAMTDLGCHQMYLLDWLLGEPSELCSTFGKYTGHAVEDSGVCTALYNQGKTVAIMDSSFTTFFSPYTFELYGTEGTVLVRIDQPGVEVHLPKEKKPWFVETLPQEAVTVREYGDRRCYQVSSAALPDDPSPLRSWVDACTKGVPVKFGIDSAVRLTHVIEGANEAYQTGKVYRF